MINCIAKDTRFEKEIDDFYYSMGSTEAKKLLAIPLIVKEESNRKVFNMPKGVLIVINKKNGKDFIQEDIENLRIYSKIASKMIDVCGKLEFFYSIGRYLKAMGLLSDQLNNNIDISKYNLNSTNDQFSTMQDLFSKYIQSKRKSG